MRSENIKRLARELMELTNEETLSLTNELKETYGLVAPEPTVVVQSTDTNPKEIEKTVFNVILREIGPNKMGVIKEWKALNSNLSLKDSKAEIEVKDAILRTNVSKAEAEEAKNVLESVSAVIEIQ